MAEQWVRRTGGARMERTKHEWSDLLPVVLRSAVHGPVTEGRFRQPWSRRLVLVKWVIKGRAEIGVGGRRWPFGPGQCAVYVPTQPHQFWVATPDTEMCWFSTDGPLVEQFVNHLGLRAGVFDYPSVPLERIYQLIGSLADQSADGCRRSSLLAIETLYDVAAKLPRAQSTSVVQQVRHLVREGLADPELSAGRIAKQLNYNRGALSRMFHSQSGTTIIDCITQVRLEEAELLLSRTDERVSDVARKCGFRDVSYFTRWIKKHTGRLPRDLRSAIAEARQDANALPVGPRVDRS
jgi:AraC-like DNA-binding protein